MRRLAGLVVLAAAVAACGGGSDETERGSATTTLAVVRPPSQVRVFVLNGNGVQGAARTKADELLFVGYAIAGVGNAPPQTGNVVACRKGFQAESAQLATAVGPFTTVVAFPKPEPDGVEDADCIVGLGT